MAERATIPPIAESANWKTGLSWKKVGIVGLAATGTTAAIMAVREYQNNKTFSRRKKAYLESLSGNEWINDEHSDSTVIDISEVTPAMRQLLEGLNQTIFQDGWEPVAVTKSLNPYRDHFFSAIFTHPTRTAVTDTEPEIDFLKPGIIFDPNWLPTHLESEVEKVDSFLKNTNSRLTSISVSYATTEPKDGDNQRYAYLQTGVIRVVLGYEDLNEELERSQREQQATVERITELQGSIVDNPSPLFKASV